MIERKARLEIQLGESLIRYQLREPYDKLKKGMSLILDAGFFIIGRKYVNALEPLYEGLGWLYLSGLPETDAYKEARRLAETYVGHLSTVATQYRVVGWRLSLDQMDCYSEIAGLTLDAAGVEATQTIFKKVSPVGCWSTMRRYME